MNKDLKILIQKIQASVIFIGGIFFFFFTGWKIIEQVQLLIQDKTESSDYMMMVMYIIAMTVVLKFWFRSVKGCFSDRTLQKLKNRFDQIVKK